MFSRIKAVWFDNKWYFLAASLLLIGGFLIGFMKLPAVQQLAENMMAQLEQIAKSMQHDKSSSAAFWLIFTNNVFSSIKMMLLGLFFAVVPIFGLFANGVLIGFVLEQLQQGGASPLHVFLVGLLPHGLFELPAVVFAAALGIRYGVLVIRSLGAIWRKEKAAQVKQDWRANIRQFPIAVCMVVLLLLVAALVESVITPRLIEQFNWHVMHM
ncbi:stage II sporulation protein M [Brevibacillus sp. B_LB10_24]|uniref:stage II sporulation protein M n=1 Tax=Brevibacillus sp. B_LB10_24 TaxID=3380645 RepID=UPI0038BD5C2B